MSEIMMASGACVLAGMMTTLHPCPLTTNIASVSMLIGWPARRRNRSLTMIYFICGYLFSYLILAILISSGALSFPRISYLLQVMVNYFIGPFLVLIGMLLADLMNLNRLYKGQILTRIRSRNWSGLSAFPFGAMIALSFCPATAAIFFGILVPLSVDHDKNILFPLLYALGASIPLIIISTLLSQGIRFSKNTLLVRYLPKIAGWILIAMGIFLSLKRIYLV
jgi:cytochrome c-type biogenesis protein